MANQFSLCTSEPDYMPGYIHFRLSLFSEVFIKIIFSFFPILLLIIFRTLVPNKRSTVSNACVLTSKPAPAEPSMGLSTTNNLSTLFSKINFLILFPEINRIYLNFNFNTFILPSLILFNVIIPNEPWQLLSLLINAYIVTL